MGSFSVDAFVCAAAGWSDGLRRVGWGVALCGLLGACVPPPPVEPQVSVGDSGGECILLGSIASFRALDDRRILIDSLPRKVIEVYSDCTGLRFSEDVLLEGRDGSVCDYRGDKLVVDGRRCTIASIREYRPERELESLPRPELNEEPPPAPGETPIRPAR